MSQVQSGTEPHGLPALPVQDPAVEERTEARHREAHPEGQQDHAAARVYGCGDRQWSPADRQAHAGKVPRCSPLRDHGPVRPHGDHDDAGPQHGLHRRKQRDGSDERGARERKTRGTFILSVVIGGGQEEAHLAGTGLLLPVLLLALAAVGDALLDL